MGPKDVGRSCLISMMLLASVATGAAAQDAFPVAGPGGQALPEGCSVFASDLLAPRFMAVADDGTIYVTEAGIGGDEVVVEQTSGVNEETSADVATPRVDVIQGTPFIDEDDEGPPQTRGYTGRVSAVAPDRSTSVIADGFPSYSEGVGPGGIALGPEGHIYIVIGGAAVLARIEPLDGENSVFRIDPVSGEATILADLGRYEVENNPDGTDVNPNMYGLVLGGDGMLYVSDAGGNTIYSVDPTSGEFSLVTVVPGLDVPADASPTDPADPSGGFRQAVPSGLMVDADGVPHVVLLSEFWPPDAASVYRIEADGSLTGVASGLFFTVGLSIGPDGSFYVTQLFGNVEGEQPAPGNVLRIGDDGTTEIVVADLLFPHGTAFDSDGNLYVTVGSVFTGPDGPPGQILLCESVAESAS